MKKIYIIFVEERGNKIIHEIYENLEEAISYLRCSIETFPSSKYIFETHQIIESKI